MDEARSNLPSNMSKRNDTERRLEFLPERQNREQIVKFHNDKEIASDTLN